MWCPSCSWVLEEVLKRTPGVAGVSVAFVTDTVQGTHLPHVISKEEIAGIATKLGYRLIGDQDDGDNEKRKFLLRLSLTAILTAQVMMISMALDGGFFTHLNAGEIRYLSIPLLFLATPVVFWGGYPILKKGISSLIHRSPSMDTMVAVAALSAFGYSLVHVFQNGLHLYFDTAAMLVTFVLFGRLLETWLREKVLSDMRGLYELTRQKVRRVDSREQWVRPEDLSADARFEVRGGETVPLDGLVMKGEAVIDESILSGEVEPIRKRPGDQVLSGSIVTSGVLVLKKERSGPESFTGQVLSLVEQAITSRNSHELLADAVSRFFAPSVFSLATGAAAVLWFLGFSSQEVLLRSLTVLLIACPCSLGLAMPLAKVSVVSAARKHGILIREPDAIEQVQKIDVAVFDKTGTLTEGVFRLQEVVTDDATDQAEVFGRLAAVERRSAHTIGREVVRVAAERRMVEPDVDDFQAFEGLGVAGRFGEIVIHIGNRGLMHQKDLKLTTALDGRAEQKEKEGMTVVFYGWSQEARGFMVFGDKLKKNAADAVDGLRSRGIAVWIVSGDSIRTTRALAGQLGVDHYVGQVVPGEKAVLVRRLQEEGHTVMMIGDGVNDAPAIAQADVGFAIASSSDIVRQASDITLLTSDPAVLNTAFSLSRRASRTVAQNLSFAFVYNACAIPLAMAGILNPPIAVCAMFASSLTVTTNALRLLLKQDSGRKISISSRLKRARPIGGFAPSISAVMTIAAGSGLIYRLHA